MNTRKSFNNTLSKQVHIVQWKHKNQFTESIKYNELTKLNK